MNKKLIMVVSLLLCASLLFVACEKPPQDETDKQYARYMLNYSQDVVLSSGRQAQGENTVFARQEIQLGKPLTAPASVPMRNGYVFDCWCLDKDGSEVWDFSTDLATDGVTLYAKWNRTLSQDEQYTEPSITDTPTVDDATAGGLVISAVCNSTVINNAVNLTTGGIALLSSHSEDIRQYLTYKMHSQTVVDSAVYNPSNGRITVNYTYNGAKSVQITVSDITHTLLVSNGTHENKAKKYEIASSEISRHSVILAGSSSMENWVTSKADLGPLTSTNHGIGGTTVEQWCDKLAKRLIYPYTPRAVVLYVGINNIINAGRDGTQTGNALIQLFDQIHSTLPDCTVYYVLMNQLPNYPQHKEKINTGNNIVIDYASQEGNEWLVTIPAGDHLIKESGLPNSAYFLTDGLHLSQCGYVVWGASIKERILEQEKILYKGE